MQTEWKPTAEQRIELQGLNLDKVWEKIVIDIGGVDIQKGKTLDKQIFINDKRKKIEKQIEKLAKQARAEKLPKKKFDLASKVKILKKELTLLNVPCAEVREKTVSEKNQDKEEATTK